VNYRAMTKDQQAKLSGAMLAVTAITIELAYNASIDKEDGPMLDEAATSFARLAELFRAFAERAGAREPEPSSPGS